MNTEAHLPPDEQAETAAFHIGRFAVGSAEQTAFVAGARWMRELAQEQLAPYLAADVEAARLRARRERVQAIVDVLFPKFDAVQARRDPGLLPPQWHDKSWWWNGVAVDWSDFHDPGTGALSVELSSYVGGGDTEHIDIDIQAAWLDAADGQWEPLVRGHITQMQADRAQAKTAREVAEAQRQIASAREKLLRLGAG